MIEVQLMSRMGNHFFQYAFAYAAAQQLGTSFRIRDWHLSPLRTLVETPSHKYNQIDKYKDLLINRFDRKKRIAVDEESFDPEDGVIYEGYYQSDRFFSAHESAIRKEFKIKHTVKASFEKTYGTFFSEQEVLCVHIRRNDYATVNLDYLGGGSLILPLSYYRENIQKLAGPETVVLFVSDDITFVEKEFSGESPNYRFSKADHFTDFLLLSYAHKIIIANSSFSWWAAYLNHRPNKEVIAPKYYLGFKVNQEYPKGIMYPGFNWVDVPISINEDE